MKSPVRTLIFLLSFFMATTAMAGPAKPGAKAKLDTKFGTDLPIMADHMIEIVAYDEESKSYEIVAVEFPGEGSTFVTPEGLARGVKALDLARILRSPTSIVGQQFKTDRKVPGLKDEERELRKKRS